MENIRGPDAKEQAKKDYLHGMKYKDLAEKYSVSLNTIKSWVKRYGWSKEKKQKGAHKSKKGAPLNNKNAVGHGAPAKNKNAEKHGFFSKCLPEETLGIIEEIENQTPLDILWGQIMLQYAAIIRAQKIMYVKDKEDITNILTSENKGDTSSSERYTIQFAWDKHATFLQAQSRAMKTLEGMLKQYDQFCKSDLATEEQKLRIKKLKIEISKLNGENKDKQKGNLGKLIEVFKKGPVK